MLSAYSHEQKLEVPEFGRKPYITKSFSNNNCHVAHEGRAREATAINFLLAEHSKGYCSHWFVSVRSVVEKHLTTQYNKR